MTDIIDCKISLENPTNFRERRMLDFSKKNIVIKVVIKLQGDSFFYEGKISINQSLIKTKHQYGNEWELIDIPMGITIVL